MKKRIFYLLIAIIHILWGCSHKRIDKKEKFMAEKRYNTAMTYLNRGLADLAEAELKEAVSETPDNAKLYSAMGQVYIVKKEYDKAIIFLDRAIELDKRLNDPYFFKGNIYMVQKKWDAAILEYKKIEYPPFFRSPHNLYNSMGLALYERGEYKEAIEKFTMALEFKYNFPIAHYNLGLAYFQIGRIELAIAEYKKAIKFFKSYAEAYNQLGLIYLKLGEKEKAKKEFAKVISFAPARKIAEEAKEYLKILD